MLHLPVPHLGLCTAAAIGAAAAWMLAPQLPRAGRIALAAVCAIALAAIAGGLGVVPWVGHLVLAWHGVLMGCGFLAAYLMVLPRARRLGVAERDLIDLLLVAVAAGLAGARARYLWERPEELAGLGWGAAIAKAVDIDQGGMVWYGGAILAGVLMAALAWRRRLPARALADIIIPACLVGLAIGRVGCFINGCCWGAATDLPWACRHGDRLVHPAQLYETAACLAIAAVLWWTPALRAGRTRPGTVAAIGIVAYAAWRFLNEFLRDHTALVERQVVGLTLTTSQITSLWLAAAAIGLWLWWRFADRRRRPAPPLTPPDAS